MNKFIVALAVLSGIVASPAIAAPMYSFSFATSTPLFGGPVSGSGVFTTADIATTVGGRTAYAISSITGTVNGSAINAPLGSYGNYFTTSPAFLDGTGLRFFTVAGNDIRFFYQDTVGQYRVNTFSPGSSSFVRASSLAIQAIPEPSTWSMFFVVLGILGTAFFIRRKHVSSVIA